MFHKKLLQARTDSEKRKRGVQRHSCGWVSWGHVCHQFLLHLLVKWGNPQESPEHQCEFWQRWKGCQVSKRVILLTEEMLHPSGIYQTPQSMRILFFHNHQSHIWLITTEISQVPHTNDLFKGTSSTRKGRGGFWLRPYVTSYEGLLGLFLPF